MELHGAFGQYGKWSSPFNRFIKPNSFMPVCPVNIVEISLSVPFLYNSRTLINCWTSVDSTHIRYFAKVQLFCTEILEGNVESKSVNDYCVVLTPRRRPILLMGRLVLGRNLWPRLTNGSSYPKTNSCAVIGMKGFMCIPLKKIDNPIVMKRGRLLLCVERVYKGKKYPFTYTFKSLINTPANALSVVLIDRNANLQFYF